MPTAQSRQDPLSQLHALREQGRERALASDRTLSVVEDTKAALRAAGEALLESPDATHLSAYNDLHARAQAEGAARAILIAADATSVPNREREALQTPEAHEIFVKAWEARREKVAHAYYEAGKRLTAVRAAQGVSVNPLHAEYAPAVLAVRSVYETLERELATAKLAVDYHLAKSLGYTYSDPLSELSVLNSPIPSLPSAANAA